MLKLSPRLYAGRRQRHTLFSRLSTRRLLGPLLLRYAFGLRQPLFRPSTRESAGSSFRPDFGLYELMGPFASGTASLTLSAMPKSKTGQGAQGCGDREAEEDLPSRLRAESRRLWNPETPHEGLFWAQPSTRAKREVLFWVWSDLSCEYAVQGEASQHLELSQTPSEVARSHHLAFDSSSDRYSTSW